ncbi:MAG: glycosyltransferase family 4 protein [Bacteroidales bacterium]|nr:glycosyltransferase family 4 protein [Bacteroidales bacterium]
MKILMLSNSKSIHTKRWVKALCERGLEICLFSLNTTDDLFYSALDNVKVVNYQYCHISSNFTNSALQRFEFFKVIKIVRRIIGEFRPDIVHAHYTLDYGSIGAAVGFHPFILSVWGSDVYGDPQLSTLSKLALRYKLRKADMILSTSNVMAKETNKYTDKKIGITPFGVDTTRFKKTSTGVSNGKFVVGNVKTLAPKYGIDVLIKAYKLVVDRNSTLDTELRIYGTGPCKVEYEHLAQNLGIADKVKFMGWVDNAQLPEIYSSFSVSVSVSVSDSESFGVVAVEAMACECPVITSDADGFTEVMEDGVTGFVVPKRDVEATADAIQKFIDNPELKQKMGTAGRNRVKRLYEWNDNVQTMINFYKDILKSK